MLRFDRANHVVVLTLDVPATRNALSGDELFGQFESAVERINTDVNARAVILTGAGPAFCSGGNVREMRDRQGMFAGGPEDLVRQYTGGIQRVSRAIDALDAPIIAAVNGPALGAGCDLACMCDIRLASTAATFAESFVKLGIIAGTGGAWFLPRIVGGSRAAEMAFTGDTIDSATALGWGLVSQVVAPDELLPAARALAGRIAANPPLAVREMKRLMRTARSPSLDQVLAASADAQARAHHTRDHVEAIAAMFEKRTPKFSGR